MIKTDNEILYHGSFIPNIKTLKTLKTLKLQSKAHVKSARVVYLTSNVYMNIWR